MASTHGAGFLKHGSWVSRIKISEKERERGGNCIGVLSLAWEVSIKGVFSVSDIHSLYSGGEGNQKTIKGLADIFFKPPQTSPIGTWWTFPPLIGIRLEMVYRLFPRFQTAPE